MTNEEWKEYISKLQLRLLLNIPEMCGKAFRFLQSCSLQNTEFTKTGFLLELEIEGFQISFTRLNNGKWHPQYDERLYFHRTISEYYDQPDKFEDTITMALDRIYRKKCVTS